MHRPLSIVRVPQANPRPARLPTRLPDATRIAVLLNRNARRVNDGLAKKFEGIIGKDHFFYSRTMEEAEGYAREIVQRGYGTVVCGGGDGTLVRAVNLVHRYIDEANAWRIERHDRFREPQTLIGTPRFAFLPLGTGNGMQPIVGAQDPATELRRLVEFGPGPTYELPLIDDGQDRFIFAGMGYDSQLLNDYNWLKSRTHSPLLKPFMHSVGGYFAAVFAKTLPRIIARQDKRLEARVVTVGRAFYVDPRRGDRIEAIEPGTTLFEGDAAMLGVGTSPFYGYGFKVFPFAGMMANMMQLRVAKIGALHTLSKLPSIWRGHYRNPSLIHDFLVEDVRIDLQDAYPFQHSGDDQGPRDHLNLQIAAEPLKLVDFHKPRPFA